MDEDYDIEARDQRTHALRLDAVREVVLGADYGG